MAVFDDIRQLEMVIARLTRITSEKKLFGGRRPFLPVGAVLPGVGQDRLNNPVGHRHRRQGAHDAVNNTGLVDGARADDISVAGTDIDGVIPEVALFVAERVILTGREIVMMTFGGSA